MSTQYRAIDYFQWGTLNIEKGQLLLIEQLDANTSVVSFKHHPEQSQRVSTQAVESMLFLKKIEID